MSVPDSDFVKAARSAWLRYVNKELCTSVREPRTIVPETQEKEAKAFAFIVNVIDRQIAKASGVLTFNGILLAAIALAEPKHLGHVVAMLCWLGSSKLMLLLSVVSVKKPQEYETVAADFKATMLLAEERMNSINSAVRLALAGAILFAGCSVVEGPRSFAPAPDAKVAQTERN